jgi:hypothetical protein
MKALTLYVPHALLIPYGWKEVETRDWYTSYRGPLAIHAAKKFGPEIAAGVARLQEITRKIETADARMHLWPTVLQQSLGCIVAVCNLEACLPTALAEYNARKLKRWFEPKLGWDFERLMGDYTPGRWAWILRDVQRLHRPIAARGMRKLWDWKAPATLWPSVPATSTPGVSTAHAISSHASKAGGI